MIGNPPYNANQQNENDNNKNRAYPRIDELIKSSYIRLSTAQKTKVYDMYARFFRWASDRLHDDGVLAFITNRSFIESRTFDGFRRAVEKEFNEIYVVDLGGDVRANPKLSGTKHNVFGIQTGVAISFMVKRHKQQGCKIFYARRPEFDTAVEKLSYLANTKASQIKFERVEPDKGANWINLAVNDWEGMLPVADKRTKASKGKGQERAIFRLYSLGVVTSRDDWVYDFDEKRLESKVKHFIERYEENRRVLGTASEEPTAHRVARDIKWTSELESHLKANKALAFSADRIRHSAYRPFVRKRTYYDRAITHRLYQQDSIFPVGLSVENTLIACTDPAAQKPWMVSVVTDLPDLHFVGAAAGSHCLPRYRYSPSGERIDNITDWALKKFREHYGKVGGAAISKDDIFHYVYGVLHDPVYREKYAINLKREFPRIPFYPDFRQWAEWGERLMAQHIGYEEVEPWPITRVDVPDEKARAAGVSPRPILRSDHDNGIIRLDSETTLSDIPSEVWSYKLGNRSGLDWILDQYKEKTPKDPTIREKFNTYRFADYKEKVIDLIGRVTRVSVETVTITDAMRFARRAPDNAETNVAGAV